MADLTPPPVPTPGSPSISPVATGLALTNLDPAFREDPYPILAHLRTHDPIHHDRDLGRYVFTRHDDVFEILRHPDYWSDPRKGNPESFTRRFLGGNDDAEPSMLLMDDPGHRRLRNLVRHPFTPRAIERWRASVRGVARRVVGAAPDGEFDLVAAIANPIPTVVIAELLGIDPARNAEFKRWSDAVIKVSFSPAPDPADQKAADAALVRLESFFLEEIAKRRDRRGEDLISAMIGAETDPEASANGEHARATHEPDRLTDHEIVMQANLLLLAGNLTTSDLIGNAVMALLRHPAELAKLRARPELMRNCVEEVLRYDSPVTNSGRIAHEDIEIDGVKIRQGDSLVVSLSAANRDPAIYPDPDRFDIERQDTHHQAFGGGRHFCLGAHLARMEAAETLSALLDRFSSLELGTRSSVYDASPSFRGFAQLWVRGER